MCRCAPASKAPYRACASHSTTSPMAMILTSILMRSTALARPILDQQGSKLYLLRYQSRHPHLLCRCHHHGHRFRRRHHHAGALRGMQILAIIDCQRCLLSPPTCKLPSGCRSGMHTSDASTINRYQTRISISMSSAFFTGVHRRKS